MTYLIGFFSSLLTNNLAIQGYGITGVGKGAAGKTKHVVLYAILYLVAGLVLGLSAYGLNWLEGSYESLEMLSYFEVVVYAAAIAIVVGLYWLVMKAAHVDEESKANLLPLIVNTSLLGICFYVVSLISDGNSDIVFIIVNSLGLALGYLATIAVFKPIAQRIEISNAGIGFKGMPLILILLAILALALGSLSF